MFALQDLGICSVGSSGRAVRFTLPLYQLRPALRKGQGVAPVVGRLVRKGSTLRRLVIEAAFRHFCMGFSLQPEHSAPTRNDSCLDFEFGFTLSLHQHGVAGRMCEYSLRALRRICPRFNRQGRNPAEQIAMRMLKLHDGLGTNYFLNIDGTTKQTRRGEKYAEPRMCSRHFPFPSAACVCLMKHHSSSTYILLKPATSRSFREWNMCPHPHCWWLLRLTLPPISGCCDALIQYVSADSH